MNDDDYGDCLPILTLDVHELLVRTLRECDEVAQQQGATFEERCLLMLAVWRMGRDALAEVR